MESYFSSSNLNAHSVGHCMAEEEKEITSLNSVIEQKIERAKKAWQQQQEKEERQKEQINNAEPAQQEVKQLPWWSEAVRGVPNVLLRSSLFTVNQIRETFSKRALLVSSTDVEIQFKGERFNQTDLNVWEMLLHFARHQPLGNEVRFTAYSMLKALNRGTGKAQHEQLKEEIVRLRSGTIEVTWKKEKKTFIRGLVKQADRDEVTQQYVVALDEKLLLLYEDGYSHINWEQRLALKGNLTKWLYGFYTSHICDEKNKYRYKVKTLHSLCGSSTKELWKFRQMLRVALAELKAVGCIEDWKIDPNDDRVHVIAIPSKSQTKHINKQNGASGRKSSTFSQIGNYAR